MTKTEAKWVLAGDPKARAAAQRVLEARRRVAVKRAPGRKAKESKRQSKSAARAETRAQCVARDQGCAVSYLGGCRGSLHHDHFFGRGRFPPDAAKEWMICEEHDHQKTENIPNRLAWLGWFKAHAWKHMYFDVVSMCSKQIVLERAQHPEHA